MTKGHLIKSFLEHLQLQLALSFSKKNKIGRELMKVVFRRSKDVDTN